MGITKNKQTTEIIIKMANEAFPQKGIPEIRELTEGMCNAAYELTYEDGFTTVLKISASSREGFMTNEVNLMEAEIKAMKLVSENTGIKVAEVYKYDDTKKICNGNYFFMEKLEGVSWISVIDNLEEEVNSRLRMEVGKLQKQLSEVSNDKFGLLGDEEHQFISLYEFVYFLISNVLEDAEKRAVVIGIPKTEILEKLTLDKYLFEAVKKPTFSTLGYVGRKYICERRTAFRNY